MTKNPRFSSRGIIAIVLGTLLMLLLLLNPDCEHDSRKAKYARSLPDEKWEALHHAFRKLASTMPSDRRFVGYTFRGDNIPLEFRELDPVMIRLDNDPLVRLQGCYDQHLDLRFYGVGEPEDQGDHSPRVVLVSGGVDRREEVLWRRQQE